MPTPLDAQQHAAKTYNAAADYFDHPANSFWDRYGRRTVARLALQPGQHVLDVCCGTGASALPAAEAVGPTGRVLGVDLAEELLSLARAKAAAQGLTQAEFRRGDMLALDLPEASFAAVVCVFGIFFIPDMPTAVRALWRLVRPGGRLAVTTWGRKVFEPLNSVFWEAVRAVRPDLYQALTLRDIIDTPAKLHDLLASGGVAAADITTEADTHDLPSAEAAWALILGSSFRGTLDQLDAAGQERVRAAVFAMPPQPVTADVIYAVAVKP